MAGTLNRRLSKATGKVSGKAAELKERLEEGAAAEDDANDAARDDANHAARAQDAEGTNQAVG
jgi:hypothetical protein